jgi:hypothetical protein
MFDKRFWSGAILALTIVVAGAGSLPALLLRPAAPQPVAAERGQAWKIAERAAAPVEALPTANVEPPPAAPAPEVAPQEPTPTPAALSSSQSIAPEPPPVTSARETAPIVFPPVQAVGVAEASSLEPAGTPAAESRPAPTKVRPAKKTARAERKAQQATKRKRNMVRPALYPIREFFAWRR